MCHTASQDIDAATTRRRLATPSRHVHAAFVRAREYVRAQALVIIQAHTVAHVSAYFKRRCGCEVSATAALARCTQHALTRSHVQSAAAQVAMR
eukprot:3909034-Prymnesium_polylepis.2